MTLEELFRYSDLVVEGVIEKISKVTVPAEDIHPDLAGPNFPMAIMDFRVDRVLVGYQAARRLEVVAHFLTWWSPTHPFDFVEGERYILSLHIPAKGRLFESGRCLVGSNSEKFLIKGSSWIQGQRNKPMAEGQLEELYNILGKVQQDRSIARLTEHAELIVRGIVQNMGEVEGQCEKGLNKHIIRVRVAVQSIMKGTVNGDSLVVSMIGVGGYRPSWRTRVPGDMQKGQEWIMFLKHADEPGYYPYAGVNGLFLVEGDVLIRDNNNRIVLPFSPEQLRNQVNRTLEGGE